MRVKAIESVHFELMTAECYRDLKGLLLAYLADAVESRDDDSRRDLLRLLLAVEESHVNGVPVSCEHLSPEAVAGRLDVLPERGDAQGAGAGYGVLVDSLRARDWGRMGAGGGRYAECPF